MLENRRYALIEWTSVEFQVNMGEEGTTSKREKARKKNEKASTH